MILLAACASAPPAAQRHEYRRVVFGVQARIVLYGSPDAAARAARAVWARLDELDQALSDWRVDSELNRVCQRAGSGPVPVSADLYVALERSLALAAASGGAFDPTAGPLVRLWREARSTGQPPTRTELDRARQRVGWQLVHLDPAARTVTLQRAGMQLDFGAIGKGLGADAALAVLRDRGFASALVEIGGDLALGSPPPGRAGWRVRIDCGAEPATVVLARAGIATSGDREQHLDHGGHRYSHILDPRTGQALIDSPCVTVVASSGATADALASAVSVLGPEAGRKLAARFPGTRVWAHPARRPASREGVLDEARPAGTRSGPGPRDGDSPP